MVVVMAVVIVVMVMTRGFTTFFGEHHLAQRAANFAIFSASIMSGSHITIIDTVGELLRLNGRVEFGTVTLTSSANEEYKVCSKSSDRFLVKWLVFMLHRFLQ